jgi:hypothetical protein
MSTIESVLLDKILADELFQESLKEAGLAVVPIEPSKAMLNAAWAQAFAENVADVWQDMIKRAQEERKGL